MEGREQGVPTTETAVVVLDKDAYDRAVADTVAEISNDPKTPEGMGKLLFLMSGTAFCASLRKRLFGEENK